MQTTFFLNLVPLCPALPVFPLFKPRKCRGTSGAQVITSILCPVNSWPTINTRSICTCPRDWYALKIQRNIVRDSSTFIIRKKARGYPFAGTPGCCFKNINPLPPRKNDAGTILLKVTPIKNFHIYFL